jgi:glycosyltransferase involved in cell wall biosynthesis
VIVVAHVDTYGPQATVPYCTGNRLGVSTTSSTGSALEMTPDVLQLVTSAERRGAETFAVDLAAGLRDRGFSTRVLALHAGPRRELDVPALGRRPLAPDTLLHVRREARTAGLVVAHGSTTLPACAVALCASGVPFVYRNIGDPTFWGSTPTRRWRVRVELARAAAVTALTPAAADAIERLYHVDRQRIIVIPSGVPGGKHRPASPEERAAARARHGLTGATVAAVVGALSPEKGVDVAIDALADLGDVQLLVAGDGPERGALEQRAHTRADGRVHFLGSVADPSTVYAAADVVVLPSRSEGLPAVLIEAGLHELPVVATRVGFVDDIVLDGVTGCIVPVDDPAALARGIRQALALGPHAGVQARERCLAKYDFDHVIDLWAALIERTRRTTNG